MRQLNLSRRWRSWIGPVYALLVCAFLVRAALMRGPWLDEFWTFWLTDPGVSTGTVVNRWMSDQHPAVFSALVHLDRLVLGGSVEVQRTLVNGAGLVVFLAVTAFFNRLAGSRSGFFKVFPIIVLALPMTIGEFADLRSYFWEIVTCAVWLEFVYYAALHDRDKPLATSAIAIGCAAAFFMIATHFAAGLQAVIVYMASAALLYPHRRRALVWTTAAAFAGCCAILLSAAVQMPHWARELDYRWIHSTASDSLDMYRTICVDVAWTTLPLVVFAIMGGVRTGAPERRYQIAITASVIIAGCAMLAVNTIQPISVPRYFVPLSVALIAVFAAGASALWSGSVWFRATLIVWALGSCWLTSSRTAEMHGWYGGAAKISRIIARCPTTKVIAISGWTYGSHAASRAAWREEPVFALGYRIAAAHYGFVPEFLALPSRRGPRFVKVGACPTILWAEHMLDDAPDGEEFAAAGLRVPDGTTFENANTDPDTADDVIILAQAPPAT